MSKTHEYLEIVRRQLDEIENQESEAILSAAQIMKETLMRDGIIYAFGTGHSQMFSLEMFYRAGGLVPVNPMLELPFNMLNGTKASDFERISGIGKMIFDKSGMTANDCLIIISHSGRNPVPVDLAEAATAAGVKLITIVAKPFMEGVTSRHESGKFVKDFADVVIDNHVIFGDAVLEIDGMPSKVAGTSSILSISIIEAIVANTIDLCAAEGFYPPVWVSGNLDDGDALNRASYLKYRNRICFL